MPSTTKARMSLNFFMLFYHLINRPFLHPPALGDVFNFTPAFLLTDHQPIACEEQRVQHLHV